MQRLALEGREEDGMMSFARSVFTFGLGFPALRFLHLRFIFKLGESLIEMDILVKHSFLHLFILHKSKRGNCDITYVLSIFCNQH